MDKQFGLQFLLQTFLGIASNVVQPGQREERKSIGAERYVFMHAFCLLLVLHCVRLALLPLEPTSTFTPLGDQARILQKLEEVAAELEDDMTKSGWTGKTVTLKYKLDTYQGQNTCLLRP